MAVVFNTLFDALKYFESGDTYDKTYDTGVCWDLCEQGDDADEFDKVCTIMQKHIPLESMHECSYGMEFVADITSFLVENLDFFYNYSQDFKWPISTKDPENEEYEEGLYYGVKIIESIMTGYIPEDDYPMLLEYFQKRYGE